MHEFDEHQQSKWRSPDCNHGDQSSRLQGPEMVQSFNIVFKEEPEDDHEPWGQRNTGMRPASSHGSEETTSTSGEPEQHQENHNTALSSHQLNHQKAPSSHQENHNTATTSPWENHQTAPSSHRENHQTALSSHRENHQTALSSHQENHNTALSSHQLNHQTATTSHRENHQTAPLSHRCCACGQEFPGAYDLMLHQRTHYIRNRVPCGTHTMTAHQQTSAVKRERGHTEEEEEEEEGEEVGGFIKCEEAATWDPQLGMSPASSHGSEETTSTSGEPEQHQENLSNTYSFKGFS
ncbi:putative zinc finger protein 286B [Salvelinus alpinus]|uniref:putative zinc finger protein 286B n=1 Tax=Salvelinus alpinus TaxID=8036 RepID=UPI0039FD7E02